ncbi:hypothetical protein BC751_2786 [Cecembia calidifontis]|jgi:hypothetical protein|uniref:Uncharacterized protein n=1 Tax=Cecembia calidifontis TaxID=1187080 RepID=A0A4Q7PBW5_9BACT|nr:hypothetical protein BC751_2786 [Cecembia calidifontis]
MVLTLAYFHPDKSQFIIEVLVDPNHTNFLKVKNTGKKIRLFLMGSSIKKSRI